MTRVYLLKKWLANECATDLDLSYFFPFSVQPTQWTSDLNDQKWVGRNHVCFLYCKGTDTWMSFSLSFSLSSCSFDGIVLVTQSYETLPPELQSLKAPLQDYSSVSLRRPPTWIKQTGCGLKGPIGLFPRSPMCSLEEQQGEGQLDQDCTDANCLGLLKWADKSEDFPQIGTSTLF